MSEVKIVLQDGENFVTPVANLDNVRRMIGYKIKAIIPYNERSSSLSSGSAEVVNHSQPKIEFPEAIIEDKQLEAPKEVPEVNPELESLKAEAKALGIKNVHLIKNTEKLLEKINQHKMSANTETK